MAGSEEFCVWKSADVTTDRWDVDDSAWVNGVEKVDHWVVGSLRELVNTGP